MNTLTSAHHQILSDWFAALHEQNEQYAFALRFALTLGGAKPATILTGLDWNVDGSPFENEDDALAFVSDVGLSTFQMRTDRNHFVAQSHARFDFLPSTASTPANDAWHRQLGVFFGYPPEAIEWFITVTVDDQITARDRVAAGDFSPEDIAYTDFVFYKNEHSIEGYERAIENDKRNRERISEWADEWDLPILDQLAEDHYQLSLSVYSGERDHFPGEHIGFKMVTKNTSLDD